MFLCENYAERCLNAMKIPNFAADFRRDLESAETWTLPISRDVMECNISVTHLCKNMN